MNPELSRRAGQAIVSLIIPIMVKDKFIKEIQKAKSFDALPKRAQEIILYGEGLSKEDADVALPASLLSEYRAVEISFDGETIEEPMAEEEDTEEMEQEELGLNTRQFDMYEMLEATAEYYGQFTQDAGPDGSHYSANSPFADEGLICAQCVFYEGGGKCEIVEGKISPMGICKLWIISAENIKVKAKPAEQTEDEETEDEETSIRAISLAPPQFMRNAAKRGLKMHEEGHSGDGLVAQTVEDARKMAGGQVSEAKWRKIGPWIARHMVDLDAPKNKNSNDPGYPGAGLVAHLLWGSGPSKSDAERAMNYAVNLVERLDKQISEKG